MTEGRSERRTQLGIPPDSTVVLMVAAFRPEKRHGIALDVCERVLKVRKEVVFVFLGGGELRTRFHENVEELGLHGCVIVPGYVDNVDSYYSIADVSILTSDKEPFGYVMLEAMRAALPVVAFDTGGPAEVIRDGVTGVLVKDGDVEEFTRKLLELIDNRERRVIIGEKARQAVVQEYSREAWIKRLGVTLNDIVEGHRRP